MSEINQIKLCIILFNLCVFNRFQSRIDLLLRIVFIKKKMQLFNHDERKFNVFSTKKQDNPCNDVAQAINRAIWPSTNVERFNVLLQQVGPECLKIGHGSRHDTCLHRLE